MSAGSSHGTDRERAGPVKARDPRLDLFRGLAMLIIFVAHVPWNIWSELIPARWGASDAAEMFIFCSGYAAALAFGGTFLRAGFWLGTARILFRCWQIYWAHLALVLAVLVVSLAADRHWPRTDIPDLWYEGLPYLRAINLQHLLIEPPEAILGLVTYRWVPNYFDILPMYVVILLMVPIVMALQRVDVRLALGFTVGLYALNRAVGLDLPAEPWSDRPWFFNPFAWQLLFFTGFALARGWLVPPRVDPRLLALAAAFVLVLVPVSQWRFHVAFPWLMELHDWLLPADAKTDFHLLRYLHFLALAYLALAVVDRHRERLGHWLLAPVVTVGQQALPAFLTSMVLAWVGGIILDHWGRTAGPLTVVNVGGLALVIGVAYLVAWYKSEPWRRVSPERSPPRRTVDAGAAVKSAAVVR